MALKRRLDKEELDLLEALEDPVWFGEFLRNTGYASTNTEEHPKHPYEYFWYQRDILTDKNEKVLLCCGRAVGKCVARGTRILTYPEGYIAAQALYTKYKGGKPFTVLAWDEEKNRLTCRRAYITINKYEPVVRLTTQSGNILDCSLNHPVYTRHGFMPAADVDVGTDVAVIQNIPYDTQKETFDWETMRWLGYALGNSIFRVTSAEYRVKYQRQIFELQQIAKFFGEQFVLYGHDTVKFNRKLRGGKSLINLLGDQWHSSMQFQRLRKLPIEVKTESNAQLSIMLESLFSMHGTVTSTEASVILHEHTLACDIQECLLRLGIETVLTVSEDKSQVTVKTRDYRSYYTFVTKLKLPGISIDTTNLIEPKILDNTTYRFEPITEKTNVATQQTFAIEVERYNTIITENIITHNTFVLEDKLLYNFVNADRQFSHTFQQLLLTPNMAQMSPLMGPLLQKIMGSPLLRSFVTSFNKSEGTYDFKAPGTSSFRMYTRIGVERNVIGLHLARIYVDETQNVAMPVYVEMQPCYNEHEDLRSQFFCGVNYK